MKLFPKSFLVLFLVNRVSMEYSTTFSEKNISHGNCCRRSSCDSNN